MGPNQRTFGCAYISKYGAPNLARNAGYPMRRLKLYGIRRPAFRPGEMGRANIPWRHTETGAVPIARRIAAAWGYPEAVAMPATKQPRRHSESAPKT